MAMTTVRRPSTASVLLLVGAVTTFVGAFLEWFDMTTPQGSKTFNGVDSTAGAATAGFGAVLIALAAVQWWRSRSGNGRVVSIIAIVVGAFVAFIAFYAAIAPETSLPFFEAQTVSEQLGVSEEAASQALQQAIDAGTIEVSGGVGGWVSAIGSVHVLAGGIVGARKMRSGMVTTSPASAVPPPPPAP